ncbi:uncharacterized protein LOC108023299 [Drosophila biarmipes]|uniref:uncharacterized protein LOC108023299 n=1 Tax=Drosophila biarmipes TaxID=125945 RepID=UPI0007E83FB1|nr:uncharacterized protein LOC108023299 [Drosophila biarmipes]
MWMQLGCRAFVKVAKNRLLRREDNVGEPTLRIADDETDESGNRYVACDKVLLPSGEDGSANKSDGVYLTNPSMNELIRTIQTLSMDQFRGILVAGRNTQESCEIFHAHAPSNATLQNGQNPVSNRRTRSLDDLRHSRQLDSSEPQLWRVRSEGNLPEPRSRVLEPNSNQSKYVVFRDDTSVSNSESISLVASISRNCSSVSIAAMDHLDDLSTEISKPQLPQNANICYWINLAHLLLVIAILRGLL